LKIKMNQVVALALVLCLASSFTVSAAKKVRIGMSVLELANPFFVALSEGAKKYAADHGVFITVNDPKNDPKAQISAIENFTASKMDAIIITATDPKAILPAIQKARAAGIKVICGINDGGALGAFEAVKAAGKASNDFFIGGIDATNDAIAKIKEGGIYRATVDQNPAGMGEKCVELAVKAVKGEKFTKDYAVKLVPVNASNVKDYPKNK
jgi:ABC-type sugar transport system substrate-binding protein